jgi:hypothetical protein
MISDVLWQAEKDIKEYLAWDPCPYGKPGEPFRDRIDALVAEMEAIRMQPGMDSPPQPEWKPLQNVQEASGRCPICHGPDHNGDCR